MTVLRVLLATLALLAVSCALASGLPVSKQSSARLRAVIQARDGPNPLVPNGVNTKAAAPASAAAAAPPAPKGVKDNVELKVSVSEKEVANVLKSLKLNPKNAEQREVTFYDTKKLELSAAGLVLRSRKVRNGADDSTVKLRPLSRTAVTNSWFQEKGFKCEVDAVGDKAMESCSLTRVQKNKEIDEVRMGKREIKKLFDNAQETWAAFGGAKFDWKQVQALGPVPSQVWAFDGPKDAKLGSEVVAELWTMPNGTQLLELSVKVPRAQWTTARAAFDAYLKKAGVVVGANQETKTKVAMTTFAAKLK